MEIVRRLGPVAVMSAVVIGACGIGACGEDEQNGPIGAATAEGGADARTDATGDARTDATDAGTDAADAPSEASAPDADKTPPYGLFVASNFNDKARMVTVDLKARTAAGPTLDVSVRFGDVVPYASGKRGFLLDRTDGTVLVLDRAAPWTIARTIDVNQGDGGVFVNPHAALVSAGAKTYVLRYGTNTIAVANADTGALSGTIDLSSFVASGDPDGLVDAFDGVYDPASGRAYALLQRIDQFAYNGHADHLNPCLPFSPLVIAIDTTTDQIVDLAGGDAGAKGLALLGQNPSALVPDLAGGRLLVVQSGCYDAAAAPDGGGVTEPRILRGIESLTLTSKSSAWLYEHSQSDRVSGLVLADATHAFVGRKDNANTDRWYAWDPTTTALGAEIASFPANGFHHGGRIFGVGPGAVTTDGGFPLSIVAYSIASGTIETTIFDAFADTAWEMNAYGSALIP
jgi:hypothetical protein